MKYYPVVTDNDALILNFKKINFLWVTLEMNDYRNTMETTSYNIQLFYEHLISSDI